MLTLKRGSISRPDGQWSDDDYDMFNGEQRIGRIMLHPQAPAGMPVLDDHCALLIQVIAL